MTTLDITDTLIAKSDQLNADDLIGGPITVQITDVRRSDGEQPVIVHISGGHRPWKPCKTMRRLMAAAWGGDGSAWRGRWLTLYRDSTVTFGKDAVGGIRISHMSDIRSGITMSLAATKGKKAQHRVEVLTPPKPATAADPALDAFRRELGAALKAGWSREAIDALLGCPAADVPPERRDEIVAALKSGPQS